MFRVRVRVRVRVSELVSDLSEVLGPVRQDVEAPHFRPRGALPQRL